MNARALFATMPRERRERLVALGQDPRTAALLLETETVRAAPKAGPINALARVEPDGSVVLTAKGLRLVSALNNGGEHHFARARRVDREHGVIAGSLARVALPAGPRWAVTITREGKALLDDDNLAASAKAVRDAVAHALGVDDGPSGPVTWSYDQVRARGYGVRVTIARAP